MDIWKYRLYWQIHSSHFWTISLWQGNLAILPDCSLPVSEFKTPLHSFTQAVIKWHIYFNLAPGYRQQSTQRTSGIFATTTTKKVLCNWLWVKRERTLRSLLSTFIHRRQPRFLKAVPRCMNGWPSRSWWSGYRILHVDSLCQKRKKEKKKKKTLTQNKSSPKSMLGWTLWKCETR